ncbi:hypothetical protein CSOJ01_05381 [Colletotrichum sojae]|uniref:Uncharacterized protein n=1 Tax=Colletotrichum sojae TaxID=2175907 RepID=A0A8H6JFY9_9PEZI|nr:hypothetical protein CSOJ01_05381 [Colletotrichum sojae]
MVADSHWDLAREVIARRRVMLEFAQMNPPRETPLADRLVLKDEYRKVYKATHAYYKEKEEIEKERIEKENIERSSSRVEDQAFTPQGRPQRAAAAKPINYDLFAKFEEIDELGRATEERCKRQKTEAQDNEMNTGNRPAQVAVQEAPVYDQQGPPSRQPTPAHSFSFGSAPSQQPPLFRQPTPANGAPAVPVAAVPNQQRVLPHKATPAPAVPFAAAVASYVPASQGAVANFKRAAQDVAGLILARENGFRQVIAAATMAMNPSGGGPGSAGSGPKSLREVTTEAEKVTEDLDAAVRRLGIAAIPIMALGDLVTPRLTDEQVRGVLKHLGEVEKRGDGA